MLASHPVMLAHGMEASLSAASAKLKSVGEGSIRIRQLCENRRALMNYLSSGLYTFVYFSFAMWWLKITHEWTCDASGFSDPWFPIDRFPLKRACNQKVCTQPSGSSCTSGAIRSGRLGASTFIPLHGESKDVSVDLTTASWVFCTCIFWQLDNSFLFEWERTFISKNGGFSLARLDDRGSRILHWPGQEMATCSGAATRFEGDLSGWTSKKHLQHVTSHEDPNQNPISLCVQLADGILTVLKPTNGNIWTGSHPRMTVTYRYIVYFA